MDRTRSFSAAVLAVLACAAVAFVIRGAVDSPPAPPGLVTAGGAARRPTVKLVPLSAARARAVPRDAALIATARGRAVRVYRYARRRDGRLLHQRTFDHQPIPLVFLVRRQRAGWVQVQLPTRPNLSSAWLRRTDVRFAFTRMRIRVSLRRHRLDLYDAHRRVLRTRIGVGRSVSPTPKGRYFVTDIVRPPNPAGAFGPYALGLSAHSDVYSSFEGGDGQVGIHGTDHPTAIGSDVSHGCIRIPNAVITRLAHTLPVGTPVTITA